MKTVLVATDFSEHGRVAGEYALALARRLDANLVCMHATVMKDAEPNSYELAHGKLEEFRQMLQREVGKKRKWLQLMTDEAGRHGVKAQHHLIDGTPAEAICKAAEELKADLVVVGSHGHTGLKRILLGSVAEKVVRLCPSSVLIARPPVVGKDGFRRVLVPTDFEEAATHALQQATVLAANDAPIDILHCWQIGAFADGATEPGATVGVYATISEETRRDAQERGAKLVKLVSGGDHQVAFHMQEGRPNAGVQAFLDKQEDAYDLIAVGTHGRTGIRRFLLGSVAEATVRYAPCSVLVAR